MTRGHISGDDYDDSRGVMAEMKITYKTKIDTELSADEQRQLLITSVAGSWTSDDSSIKLSNREVRITCSCVFPNVDQSKTRKPTVNAFDYDTNFDEYVCVDGFNAVAGAEMDVTLKRGTSSSWLFNYDMLGNLASNGGEYISW